VPFEQAAATGETIDLGDGLSLHLATAQQSAAARYVVREVFTKRRYEHAGFDIRPTDTVVDIGANMGVFALWAARQARRGRVIAVEPTSAIEVLRTNVERNRLPHVVAVQAAAGRDGDEPCEMTTYPGFNIVSHRSGWKPMWTTRTMIRLAWPLQHSDPVVERSPVKSLKRILEENGVAHVHYLKVDCEGCEYDIFRDLDDDTFARIDRVAMEFHEYAPHQRHEELVERLRGQGFTTEVHKPFFEYRVMRFGMLWARR
jgi:FkbM family methyltransferase